MTVEELNSQPMSSQARNLLRQAGEKPDPTAPYLTQLVEWGLNNGLSLNSPQGITALSLLEQVSLLPPPQVLQACAMLGEDLPDKPKPAAEQLLESLCAWMVEKNPHWQSLAE